MTREPRTARLPRPRLGSRADAGSASVELTVLVTPLFVVLLLFVALCARTVSAEIDVNAAASSAARAASLARSPGTARTAATAAASSALASQSVTCASLAVSVDTSAFRRGGSVAVEVTCAVALSDLGLPGVPGSRVVSGAARAPIDIYRQVQP